MSATGETTLEQLRAQADALLKAGKPAEAAALHQQILRRAPGDFEASRLLGMLAIQFGNPDEGRRLVEAALMRNPNHAEAWLHHGMALQQLGRLGDALKSYDRALHLNPSYPEALFAQGVVLRMLARPDEALAAFDKLISLRADLPHAFFHRATLLHGKAKLAAALADHETVLTLAPDHVDSWLDRGAVLLEMDRLNDALESFEQAQARAPDRVEVWYNRGVALQRLGRAEDALAAYERAVAIDPQSANNWTNRGSVLRALGRLDDALASYDRALSLDPRHVETLINRGNTLQAVQRLGEAAVDFARVIDIAPDHAHLLGGLLTPAVLLCEWEAVELLRPRLDADIPAGRAIVSPFLLQAVSDDPALLQAAARNYQRDLSGGLARERPSPVRGGKIRLAYVSDGFCEHPAGGALAALVERHDRSRFEVIGVCHGRDGGGPLRKRLEAACDQFHDVRGLNDGDAAALLRGCHVDIAVDLKGFTPGARPGLFRQRPAPVQVSWLGTRGTMGSEAIDYILADAAALPHDQQAFYDERIVHLPITCQPPDPALPHPATPARAAAGLPELGFVFCCFSPHWRITRPVFDVWMRLLAAKPGSVLWLIDGTASATLRREAAARGIDAERLVFAPQCSAQDHLARCALANVMLDTAPCNAAIAARDALWMGVPLVTCRGAGFAGRLSAGLLDAAGVAELIAPDMAGYEALALALAGDPNRRGALSGRMIAARTTAPLFDADRFARDIEAAFAAMMPA